MYAHSDSECVLCVLVCKHNLCGTCVKFNEASRDPRIELQLRLAFDLSPASLSGYRFSVVSAPVSPSGCPLGEKTNTKYTQAHPKSPTMSIRGKLLKKYVFSHVVLLKKI